MQPTQTQVDRSLEALLGHAGKAESGSPEAVAEVPAELHATLAATPEVRVERLEQARRRLAEGLKPTDEDLAGRMVGRLVCDRLR